MHALFSPPLSIILIVAISAMQLPEPPPQISDVRAKQGDSPAPLPSERESELIEYIYMDEVRKSRITKKSKKDNLHEQNSVETSNNNQRLDSGDDSENEEEMDTYVCRRMARLQRVPLCVRLFDQPHYRDELKIKFSFLAYRGAKPDCEKHELSFRTKSMMSKYTSIKQEMLLCPGRHHPLRTSWQLDDYRDVFYVSSGAVPPPLSTQLSSSTVSAPGSTEPEIALEGAATAYEGIDSGYTPFASGSTEPVRRPIPDSLVVYKRIWDADTEQFVVYDIIKGFSLKTLTFAIVTEYDIEEDLHSMNAISYNNNAAEVEVIYIREMFKPLDPYEAFRRQQTQLTRQDTIADLSGGELVTLCWVILDQPQYKEIDFNPQPPPKQMDNVAVVAEHRVINFQNLVGYNKKAIQQTMYACKPRSKRIPLRGTARANPERIQISSGARPDSYFVYTLHKGKDWGKYRIFEFVENLPIKRGTSIENFANHEATVDSPTRRNTADFEKQFIEIIHTRDAKKDIVCEKLKKSQFRTICVRLFQTDHYAREVGIFFNYRLSIMGGFVSCQKRKVTIVSIQSEDTAEIHHRMGVCEGRHENLRTNHDVDDYKDLFHVSQGPDSNSVMVFRQNKTADAEWYEVYDIVSMENLEVLEESEITFNHIQEEYRQRFKPSFDSNGPDIEVIYIREVFKVGDVVDTLAGQSEGTIIALCYELLDRDPHKPVDFEISRPALYTWRTRIKTYQLAFSHSKEYNDEHLTQPMYPCYGRHKDPKVGWRLDEYLHLYKISSGGRPNSFFLYSLLTTEDQKRIYTLYGFVENFRKLETLKPVEITLKEVYEDLIQGNSSSLKARPKSGTAKKTQTGKSKHDEIKDVKSVNNRNRPKGPTAAEPRNSLKNQKPVQINQNKPPMVKSTPTKSDEPSKGTIRKLKPIKSEQESSEVLKRVTAGRPITQQNPGKPKAEVGNMRAITTQPGKPRTEVSHKKASTTQPSKPKVDVSSNTKPIKPELRKVGATAKLTNNLERRPQTNPDGQGNAARERPKPTETGREEVAEIVKHVTSEELKPQPLPEEPAEINTENSELVEQEQKSEILKRIIKTGGRKTWTYDEPINVAEGKPERKTWETPDEPIKVAEEKLTSVESKQDISPSEISPVQQLPQPKSEPTKPEVKTSESLISEIERVRSGLRRVKKSDDQVPVLTVTEPIETDAEKSAPVKLGKVVSKQYPSQGFTPPSNVRTGGKVTLTDIPDSQNYHTVR